MVRRIVLLVAMLVVLGTIIGSGSVALVGSFSRRGDCEELVRSSGLTQVFLRSNICVVVDGEGSLKLLKQW